MNTDKLVEELRKWEGTLPNIVKDSVIERFREIISRHTPSPAKEEPLACLADRKGYWFEYFQEDDYPPYQGWGMFIFPYTDGQQLSDTKYVQRIMGNKTYAECELKARAFLNQQTDVKGGNNMEEGKCKHNFDKDNEPHFCCSGAICLECVTDCGSSSYDCPICHEQVSPQEINKE